MKSVDKNNIQSKTLDKDEIAYMLENEPASKHYVQFTQNRRETIARQTRAARKAKRKHFFLLFIFLFLLSFTICFGAEFLLSTYNEVPDVTSTTSVVANENTVDGLSNAEKQLVKNTVNILLVGEDDAQGAERGRTDSIIIATIDPALKKIKLTSLMRDMYVDIPGYKDNKINAAYSIGGIDLLKKTIKRNFNLDLDKYVIINFEGFAKMIDALGGIEAEVKDYEISELNKYIISTPEHPIAQLKNEGVQKLNGQQALSYARIRKVGNSDYERTERQRRVLSLLLQKAKASSITQYPKLFTSIAPYIKTNMSKLEIMNLGYTAYQFNSMEPETLRIPIDRAFESTEINGASVLVPNLKKNSAALYNFIYEQLGNKYSSEEDGIIVKPTTTPKVTATPKPTTTPSTTTKPTVTPSTTPKSTTTPSTTPKTSASPSTTPKPTATIKPTATPITNQSGSED